MKAFSKTLVMMAVLTSACFAHAAEGDVKTGVTQEKLTGNSLIKSVSECRTITKNDYQGNMYIEAIVQYTTCDEVVKYTVDIVDKGWWQTEEQNARDAVYFTRISTQALTNSNQFNGTNLDSGSQDPTIRMVEKLGSTALDTMSLKAQCEAQRESLVMQYQNQNRNTTLAKACGL